MKILQLAVALTAFTSFPLAAQTSLDLGGYTLGGTFTLPFAVPEASAITYNWDRDSFVIVDDEAFDVVEINRSGQQLGRIRISGHPNQPGVNTTDAEAITYLGNNRYMYGLERIRAGFVFETTFPDPVQIIDLAQSTRIDLFGTPDNVGNAGLEGLSYDPTAAVYYGVKEKTPLDVYRFTFEPVTLGVDLTRPFTTAQIAAFGVTDFADIQKPWHRSVIREHRAGGQSLDSKSGIGASARSGWQRRSSRFDLAPNLHRNQGNRGCHHRF